MRVVWVSYDTIGRDCLLAAAAAGAEIAAVITLPGPIDPNRSGQCSFDEVATSLGVPLLKIENVNAPETVEAVRALEPYCGEFLYTHVDKEGLMQGTDLAAITAVRNSTRRPLIAAGGVTTQAEIDELARLGIDAVVGMAIYTGALDLERAFRQD